MPSMLRTHSPPTTCTCPQPRTLLLKVLPLPRVAAVVPALTHTDGGSRVTVTGQYFGSKYSRGYGADAYGNIAVYIGGARCSGERVISDSAVSCMAPPGVGVSAVSVNISDGALTRSGFKSRAFTQSLMYFGGSLSSAGAFGFRE
jgi:hypothetical protein